MNSKGMVNISNSCYHEPLETEELAYLEKHAVRQRKTFLRVVHYIFLGLALLMTALYTLANFTYDPAAIDDKTDTPLSPGFVLQVTAGIMLLFAAILGLLYYFTILSLFREIRKGYKIVEQAFITEKKYMSQTATYHFYLNSRIKKSIEVSRKDYDFYDVNDELNIEYSPESHLFFGYY